MEPGPSLPGERSPVGWEQQAGFSVFFDLARDDTGSEIWQVRLYHEESADEAVVVGRDVEQFARWMANRVGVATGSRTSPSGDRDAVEAGEEHSRRELVVEVVSVQLVDRPSTAGDEEEARVEAVVRLAGLPTLLRFLGGAVMQAALDQPSRDE